MIRHARLLLVSALLAGPVAWAFQLAVALAIASPAVPPIAATFLCVGAAAFAGALRKKLPERGEAVDDLPPRPWLATAAVATASFFALVCAASAAAVVVLGGAGAAP